MTPAETLLFAYRAVACGGFAKAALIGNIAIQRRMDRGHPLHIQEQVQRRANVIEAGRDLLDDMRKLRARMENDTSFIS